MKKIIIILIFFLLTSLYAKAQNLFFVGTKSYPSTKEITLNPKSGMGNYLNVIIAKKGDSGVIALRTHSSSQTAIRGKAFIFLDNGEVITLIDRGIYDFENNESTTVYSLTPGEILKIKSSNVNTIRFTIKCIGCAYSSDEGNHSVINSGSAMYGRPDFGQILTKLFED